MPMEIADDAVVSALKKHLLNPAVLNAAIRRVPTAYGRQRRSLRSMPQSELAKIEHELSNLVAAVAAGGDIPHLVAAIRERECRRQMLTEQLARPVTFRTFGMDTVLADLHNRLTEWRELLRDNVPKARGLLKQLIVGRLLMHPDREERRYRFNGTGTLEPVLAGIVPTLLVPQCVASLVLASWNRIAAWLKQVDAVRQAA